MNRGRSYELPHNTVADREEYNTNINGGESWIFR
jgi:hypothetical protein